MTNQLIPVQKGIISGEKTQICNARDLHDFLMVGRDFTTWIKGRINEYLFRKHEDYELCSPDSGSKGRGGHNVKEYHLTLDMAKELAMIERTPKGREARQYFIRCEKELLALRNTSPLSPPDQPFFSKLDAGLMRELRRVNANLVQAYLMAFGVTPQYVAGLIGNTPPSSLVDQQSEVAPVQFIKDRVQQYSSGEDRYAYYFTREKFSLLCDGYDLRETAQWLRDLGYLKNEGNRLTSKGPRSIFKGSRRNVFVVLKTILDEDVKGYDHG